MFVGGKKYPAIGFGGNTLEAMRLGVRGVAYRGFGPKSAPRRARQEVKRHVSKNAVRRAARTSMQRGNRQWALTSWNQEEGNESVRWHAMVPGCAE